MFSEGFDSSAGWTFQPGRQSDDELEARSAETRWRDPRPDDPVYEHANRRCFLIGGPTAKTCRTQMGLESNSLPDPPLLPLTIRRTTECQHECA
jgi:hypothetical protein